MAYAARSMYEASMRFAAPMWGLVEDHAVAAVQTEDGALVRVLDEASEEVWSFNSEWIALEGDSGRYALRVDLGTPDGSGLDLTLRPTMEDVEVLQGYELLEVWVEYQDDPMASSFRTRPRRSDILTAAAESGAVKCDD